MAALSQNVSIIYEQPLSERIRAFLRLEFLFKHAHHLINAGDPWSSRTMVEVIIDVMAVMSRSDLKKELIKELERQANTLEPLSRNPNVDQQRLTEVLGEVKALLLTLRSIDYVPGHELKNDELLSAVRQRSGIPAGTCDFDLPAYHFWLQRTADERLRHLNQWLASFDLLREAVTLCLRLVRESALASIETARRGFFQENIEASTPCQMIRVSLPAMANWYPEVSAGKHRFSIRFMQPGEGAGRPLQSEDDIEFGLHRCVI